MVLPRREDYTNEASEALERAHAWASDMRNAQLDAEHLALGMLSIKDGMATKIFEFLGVDLSEMKKDLEFSSSVVVVIAWLFMHVHGNIVFKATMCV